MKKITIAIATILLASCSTQKNYLFQRKGFFEGSPEKGYVFKAVTPWQPFAAHSKTDTVYQYALTSNVKKLP